MRSQVLSFVLPCVWSHKWAHWRHCSDVSYSNYVVSARIESIFYALYWETEPTSNWLEYLAEPFLPWRSNATWLVARTPSTRGYFRSCLLAGGQTDSQRSRVKFGVHSVASRKLCASNKRHEKFRLSFELIPSSSGEGENWWHPTIHTSYRPYLHCYNSYSRSALTLLVGSSYP